jgi:hypothetical protein
MTGKKGGTQRIQGQMMRAEAVHVKGIVKKGRAYYADKKKGVGFWDAHNIYYVEQRGKYNMNI